MGQSKSDRDENLDALRAGVRSHDMHHGLIRKQSGLINHYMKRTKVTGTAAQLCSVLKDFEAGWRRP
jgi:hypothetical protein